MIEAMTEGGFKKRGIVFCPEDAVGENPVILHYARTFPERIEVVRPRQTYRVENFEFETSMRHIHPVTTYGFKFRIRETSVAYLADTKYFKELESFYHADLLIVSVVFFEPRPTIDHVSLPEAADLIRDIKPKKALLTHFGMTMLKAKPDKLADELSQKLGIEVKAAYDGMRVEF
jgi:ribonuclease BN (tRNA processing enzyme)